MDPVHSTPSSPSCRFPRTRGDGPCAHSRRSARAMFPPHARGWTLCTFETKRKGNVSPARAGMDPVHIRDEAQGQCFPRTRGDGPGGHACCEGRHMFPPHARGWTPVLCLANDSLPVSPARAGMDPSTPSSDFLAWCFPRTRGDGPPRYPGISLTAEFPPHARGWTPYGATKRPRLV